MFTQRNLRISVVVVIALLSIVREVDAGSTPVAPFIYYYSVTRHAFIIERADGSESRILADYRIPSSCYDSDNCSLEGPGWSPSGQWFAWTFRNGGLRLPPREAQAMLVSRDGIKRLTLLDGQGSVQYLRWSPTSDLLLFERYMADGMISYYIWDARTQQIETPVPNMPDGSSDLEWSPGGKYLVLYRELDQRNSNEMEILSTEGKTIATRTISPLSDGNSFPSCSPEWSMTDEVVYIRPDSKLVIEDFAASQSLEYDFPRKFLVKADWSPDGKYALLYADNACQPKFLTSQSQVWYLSVSDGTLKLQQ